MKRTVLLIGFLIITFVIAGCSSGISADKQAEAEPSESTEIEEPSDNPSLEPPVGEPVDQTGDEETDKGGYQGGFSKDQRVADAQMLIGMFERGYAPRAWKEEFLGLSFDDHSEELLNCAKKDIGDWEFYECIGQYVAGFHDSHTSFSFPSTRRSYLPFDVEEIEGKFIVVALYEGSSSVEIGDELISLCGKDPGEERAKIVEFVGEGNPRAELRTASYFLTLRVEEIIPNVPAGKCDIKFKSRSDGQVKDVSMEWVVEGHELAELNNPSVKWSKAMQVPSVKESIASMNILEQSRIRIHPRHELFGRSDRGNPQPFFPLWDSYVKREQSPFMIGIYKIDDRKIGFIRIHTYYGVDYDDAIKDLAKEIPYLEANTDALVIDQTGNTGGDICFGMELMAYFFSTPQKETEDHWRANRDNLTMFEYAEMMSMTPNDQRLSGRIAENMREAMKNGDLLTVHLPVCNEDGMFRPHKDDTGEKTITYTKPVLMLIDEFAVSAGDYIPAIMKDAGRVTMFGKATSGAGGAIKFLQERMGYSEISLSYTISLGWREPVIELPDGRTAHYIENVGVLPDVEYDITVDDVVNGYKGYRNAIDQSVLSLLKFKQ